ncbi:MAG: nickel-dependent lactate racemase [Dehalococcoidia bacterium]
MDVRLSYGKTGLIIKCPPKQTTVIEPTFVNSLPDPKGAIQNAIRNPIDSKPLKSLVKLGQKVGISVCDITRPIPSKLILPIVLNELKHIPKEDITIFIATGTHRANTKDELVNMLGSEIVDDFKLSNHNAFDNENLVNTGFTENGIPIELNKTWIDQDVKITLGFVEPHFFAGFSGGPKMVAPGLAGFKTIMALHDYQMIANENARWGVTIGNPIHDSIREIATKNPVTFAIDVTLNRNNEITCCYAGNLFKVHNAAIDVIKRVSMKPIQEAFDIVVTTNSGYPLDLNMYQSIKGISAAYQIVKKGGIIICASECSDGIPKHGEYKNILSSASNPKELLEQISNPKHKKHDQWQAQIQAQIQTNSSIKYKSDFLSDEQIEAAFMEPISDISETIQKILKNLPNTAKVCVLPEGPQTIPYLINKE